MLMPSDFVNRSRTGEIGVERRLATTDVIFSAPGTRGTMMRAAPRARSSAHATDDQLQLGLASRVHPIMQDKQRHSPGIGGRPQRQDERGEARRKRNEIVVWGMNRRRLDEPQPDRQNEE